MIKTILTDAGRSYNDACYYFTQANAWAHKNCPSYLGYQEMDMSDFSFNHDVIAEYKFNDEQDLIMFTLRWS